MENVLKVIRSISEKEIKIGNTIFGDAFFQPDEKSQKDFLKLLNNNNIKVIVVEYPIILALDENNESNVIELKSYKFTKTYVGFKFDEFVKLIKDYAKTIFLYTWINSYEKKSDNENYEISVLRFAASDKILTLKK